MGTTIIPEGVTLPIALLITDGSTGKYPQAELYTPTGTLLATIDLVHRAKGLYTPASAEVMTSDDYVTAVYIVYEDAGHTVESTSIFRSSEIFAKGRYVELSDVVDGSVTVQTALARINSMAAGRIVKSGNQYTYRNSTDTSDLFTLEDNTNERTPL